jgi:hypothetical protein
MSVYSGPSVSTQSLEYTLDAANRKSATRGTQTSNILVDPNTWTTGTGGFTGYGTNGSASEQLRAVVADDPWGSQSVIWRTVPDDVSGADGGWNTSSYAIDRTFMYRYSVWVRRHTAGTGGTFYMGMNPAPIRNDNGLVQSNPYFSFPSQGSLALNQWYLVVAHVFPEGYQGGRHPDSGWYQNGQKISDPSLGNVGAQDVRWNAGTTSALHRVYHYYTTNTSSGLEFAFPRLDKCDGSEPRIQDMITRGESQWVNLVNKNIKAKVANNVAFDFSNGGSYRFDGSAKWVDLTGINISGDRTVSFWVYPREVTTNWRSVVDSQSGRYIIGTISNLFQIYTVNNWRGGPTATLNTWQHITFATQGNLTKWYKNGVYVGSYTGTVPAIAGTTIIGARFAKETAYLNADLSKFTIYSRALNDVEIRQNFNALKGRYGL